MAYVYDRSFPNLRKESQAALLESSGYRSGLMRTCCLRLPSARASCCLKIMMLYQEVKMSKSIGDHKVKVEANLIHAPPNELLLRPKNWSCRSRQAAQLISQMRWRRVNSSVQLFHSPSSQFASDVNWERGETRWLSCQAIESVEGFLLNLLLSIHFPLLSGWFAQRAECLCAVRLCRVCLGHFINQTEGLSLDCAWIWGSATLCVRCLWLRYITIFNISLMSPTRLIERFALRRPPWESYPARIRVPRPLEANLAALLHFFLQAKNTL